MFTLDKDKAPISTNDVKAYSKKALGDKIRRLITANTQLMIDKIEVEKARINLKIDRI